MNETSDKEDNKSQNNNINFQTNESDWSYIVDKSTLIYMEYSHLQHVLPLNTDARQPRQAKTPVTSVT